MGNLWKIFENTHSWGQHVEFWGGIFHCFCGPMWSRIFQHPPSKSRLHVEPGRSHRIAGEPGILVMFIRSKWTYAHCGQGILLAVWVGFFLNPGPSIFPFDVVRWCNLECGFWLQSSGRPVRVLKGDRDSILLSRGLMIYSITVCPSTGRFCKVRSGCGLII